ncbi:hypothetical protein VNO77_28829 [Canavalia gladiata]|uniref:Uncharacterized protein n=1 Tax=Canavalia gladiata TaxID=3824 RepID=A0AAN9KWG6_CANGL
MENLEKTYRHRRVSFGIGEKIKISSLLSTKPTLSFPFSPNLKPTISFFQNPNLPFYISNSIFASRFFKSPSACANNAEKLESFTIFEYRGFALPIRDSGD